MAGRTNFSQEDRDRYAKSGVAMPDGSFPIRNASDLEDAIRLVGHAKDPSAAKAHIKKRARKLHLVHMIPMSWM